MIYAGQGPPPPSPLVVERFQQVISQLFKQVRRLGWPGEHNSGGTRRVCRRRQWRHQAALTRSSASSRCRSIVGM